MLNNLVLFQWHECSFCHLSLYCSPHIYPAVSSIVLCYTLLCQSNANALWTSWTSNSYRSHIGYDSTLYCWAGVKHQGLTDLMLLPSAIFVMLLSFAIIPNAVRLWSGCSAVFSLIMRCVCLLLPSFIRMTKACGKKKEMNSVTERGLRVFSLRCRQERWHLLFLM